MLRWVRILQRKNGVISLIAPGAFFVNAPSLSMSADFCPASSPSAPFAKQIVKPPSPKSSPPPRKRDTKPVSKFSKGLVSPLRYPHDAPDGRLWDLLKVWGWGVGGVMGVLQFAYVCLYYYMLLVSYVCNCCVIDKSIFTYEAWPVKIRARTWYPLTGYRLRWLDLDKVQVG